MIILVVLWKSNNELKMKQLQAINQNSSIFYTKNDDADMENKFNSDSITKPLDDNEHSMTDELLSDQYQDSNITSKIGSIIPGDAKNSYTPSHFGTESRNITPKTAMTYY
jgi:hypothetical protein